MKMHLKNHQEDKECANDIQFPSVPWLQVHLLMRNCSNFVRKRLSLAVLLRPNSSVYSQVLFNY